MLVIFVTSQAIIPNHTGQQQTREELLGQRYESNEPAIAGVIESRNRWTSGLVSLHTRRWEEFS